MIHFHRLNLSKFDLNNLEVVWIDEGGSSPSHALALDGLQILFTLWQDTQAPFRTRG